MSGSAVRVLLRSHLRRDRWMIGWWVLGGTLLYYSQAVSIDGLYASQAELDRAAAGMEGNAALVAMAGPARALNTIGGQVTWQATASGAVVAGLMSMFLVTRHTRAEEESGRDELVRSAVVGRLEPLLAALLVTLVANLLLGALVTLSLVSYSLAVADSVALGVGLALTGMVLAGVTLVAAQLSASSRTVHAMVGAALGAAYALRAVGDVTGGALSWLSPIGWYQAMHAFSGLRWWPAGLLAAAVVVTVPAAVALLGRRDVGGGLWAARPGPAVAGRGLHGALGLTWRLQRTSVAGWSAGLLLTGLAYGSIGDSAGELLGDSGAAREVFVGGGDVVAGFFATSGVVLALFAAGFAVSSALRLRGEEDDGRAEVLLATALRRRDWLGAHAAVTTAGSLVVLASGALGIALGYLGVTGDGAGAVRNAVPVLTYAGPVLVLATIALLVQAVGPRLAVLAWVPLVLAVVVAFFGELWQLPGWVRGLSPYDHLALAPVEAVDWVAVVVVPLVALALGVAAQVTLDRRDIG